MNDLQSFVTMLAKSDTSFKKERVEGGSWSVQTSNILSTGAGVFNVVTEFRFTKDGEYKEIRIEKARDK